MPDPDRIRDDVPDLDIRSGSDDRRLDEPGGRPVPWALLVVLIVGAAIAGYVLLRRPAAPQEAVAPAATESPAAPAAPLGGQPAPITVPPLDETDALVRELVRQLTSHPLAASWLTTDGLVRNFTVVVANIADGASPGVHLRGLRPTAPFQVTQSGQGLIIDPRSYHRYDSMAAAAEGIDAAGAARIYSTLKPRVAEAYRDLGHPDTPFDRTLEGAIVELLETPIVEGPIRVHPTGGVGYAFSDPNLESLTDAQRNLLRTGPENTRKIQQALRSVAGALGIPSDRLPPSRTVRGTR